MEAGIAKYGCSTIRTDLPLAFRTEERAYFDHLFAVRTGDHHVLGLWGATDQATLVFGIHFTKTVRTDADLAARTGSLRWEKVRVAIGAGH